MKTTRIQLASSAALFSLGLCSAGTVWPDAADAATQKPAVQLIGTLADYKNFRAKAADLDAVVAVHCKKTKALEEADRTYFKYTCAPATGIKSVRIDTRHPAGQVPYVLTLAVIFSNEDFSAVKKVMQEKLGKSQRERADYARWTYTKDPKLSEHGNPIVSLARDDDTKFSNFGLALEQGP